MIHGVRLDAHRIYADGDDVKPITVTLNVVDNGPGEDITLELTDEHGTILQFALHEFDRAQRFVITELQVHKDIERNRAMSNDDDNPFDV